MSELDRLRKNVFDNLQEIERLKEQLNDEIEEELKQSEIMVKKQQEIERLNNIINRIESIYSSLCFSAPENNYIFIEKLGEVLQELKGEDKE